jgi:hypothetical protein
MASSDDKSGLADSVKWLRCCDVVASPKTLIAFPKFAMPCSNAAFVFK